MDFDLVFMLNGIRLNNAKGSAVLIVIVLLGVALCLLNFVMPSVLQQIEASSEKQKQVDFRQVMSALFLTYTSQVSCTQALNGVALDNEMVDLGNHPLEIYPGKILQPTTQGATLMGMQVDKINLQRIERFGDVEGKQLWFVRLVVETSNRRGLASHSKAFTLPLMVFVSAGRIVACNSNSGLLSYDAYYNPDYNSSTSSPVNLSVTPYVATAAPGISSTVSCPAGEDLLAVNYSVMDSRAIETPNYTSYIQVHPLPTNNETIDDTSVAGIIVDVESTVPGCTAVGGTVPVKCRIFCGRLDR